MSKKIYTPPLPRGIERSLRGCGRYGIFFRRDRTKEKEKRTPAVCTALHGRAYPYASGQRNDCFAKIVPGTAEPHIVVRIPRVPIQVRHERSRVRAIVPIPAAKQHAGTRAAPPLSQKPIRDTTPPRGRKKCPRNRFGSVLRKMREVRRYIFQVRSFFPPRYHTV